IRYFNEGLDRPESIEATRESWKSDMDYIADYISERWVKEKGASIGASELYQDFYDWAKKRGHEHPISQTAFGTRLSDRGFEKCREGGTGRITYGGFRLKKVGEQS